MKTATLCHKVVCVLINFYWQMFYLRNSLWDVLKQGGATDGRKGYYFFQIDKNIFAVVPYICLMSGWLQEEYVVLKHLLK